MSEMKQEAIQRILLTLFILSAGLVLVPFVDMPAAAIGWELFAGVYTPVLEVNATTGAPGSVFYFTGSNYPPGSLATIYIDGRPVGTVTTDGSGAASFLVNTLGAASGAYNVTLETDINASATQSIDLVSGGLIVTPPPGATGTTVFVNGVIFLPIIQAD
ncbi:MAG: hypothetical protein KC415_01035 [Anaerolineales bacterium]|nr:hypothetical protein [Anaerolineales bacterium]MCB8983692.1 hypothetical protein [Ardenticatenaceae bacterium]